MSILILPSPYLTGIKSSSLLFLHWLDKNVQTKKSKENKKKKKERRENMYGPNPALHNEKTAEQQQKRRIWNIQKVKGIRISKSGNNRKWLKNNQNVEKQNLSIPSPPKKKKGKILLK